MIQNLIQAGEPAEHRGIVVTPLFPKRDPVTEYVTLDDALPQGLRVREVDESGSVPELVVENPLEARVLLYDGEELVGAKQNRILNVSVLVEAKTTLTIPVSCVEEGRWSRVSPSFASGSHISHGQLRRRKAEAQAAQPLARGVAQGVVWDALYEKALHMSVDSPTGASSDLYRAHERDLRVLEDAFPAQPGQCGAVLGNRERPLSRPRLAARRLRAPVAEAPCGLSARCARAPGREAVVGVRCGSFRRCDRRLARDAAALGGSWRGRAASRAAGDRLGTGARGRGHPALGVPQRGRRPTRLRPDRASQPETVTQRLRSGL